jgi:hypothetical protein
MTDDRHRQVRDDSDELIDALDEMKRMEKAKRDEDISTPPFHRLAEDVEDQARHVFSLAAAETVDGNHAPTTGVSTNEVRPSDDGTH